MKSHFIWMLLVFTVAFTTVRAGKTELYESRYFSFHSNQQLNAHLFLYNKAIGCKFGKVPDDSLVHYALKDKKDALSSKDQMALNSVLRYYRDSLLKKDLLFDSLMRNFSDCLGSSCAKNKMKGWQVTTYDQLKTFLPFFEKLWWPSIDSANKVWLNTYKGQIIGLETKIIPELERIYKTQLSDRKIRVDLSSYATWAGAYSYNDTYNHVVLSTVYKSNQGDLAAEVVFHETSHFLVDKLSEQIMTSVKGKEVKNNLNLWHNVIFYTTGFLMEKEYKLKWQKFEPYYVHLKFEERFSDFKSTVEGCKLYWDPYLNGNATFESAVKQLVDYQLSKQ